MRKWLFGVVLYSFLLCLCANACAMEPPVIDYEGFAAYLQEQGINIPQTLEEAIGDEDFSDLPEYELIVDEENDQYILRTDLEGIDAYILHKPTESEGIKAYTASYFEKTDEPETYIAKGIGDHFVLRITIHEEKDPSLDSLDCSFYLNESGRCYVFEKGHFLTDTLYVSRHVSNDGDGTGTFTYSIRKNGFKELYITFNVPTGEVSRVNYYEEQIDASLEYLYKSLYFIGFEDYYYHSDDGWKKDRIPCEPLFEVTPELYPYPSFLP